MAAPCYYEEVKSPSIAVLFVVGVLLAAAPAGAQTQTAQSSTALDALCTSQYDYACEFGQTDKQGKQCGYGLPVANTEVKGICVTENKAQETSYVNADGQWVSGSKPLTTAGQSGAGVTTGSTPQVTPATGITLEPPSTPTGIQTQTALQTQDTITPGTSVLDNAFKWLTGQENAVPSSGNLVPNENAQNIVFNPEPTLPSGQAQSLTSEPSGAPSSGSTPNVDYQPSSQSTFSSQPMGSLPGLTNEQAQNTSSYAQDTLNNQQNAAQNATDVTATIYYPGCVGGPSGCSVSQEGGLYGSKGNYLDPNVPTVAAGPDSGYKFGQVLSISNPDSGQSVNAVVGDVCPSCGKGIDLTPAAANAIGLSNEQGAGTMQVGVIANTSSYGSGSQMALALNSNPNALDPWSAPPVVNTPSFSQPDFASLSTPETWSQPGPDLETKTPAELQLIQDQLAQQRINEAPAPTSQPTLGEQFSQWWNDLTSPTPAAEPNTEPYPTTAVETGSELSQPTPVTSVESGPALEQPTPTEQVASEPLPLSNEQSNAYQAAQNEALAFSPPGYQYNWASPSENEALAYQGGNPAPAPIVPAEANYFTYPDTGENPLALAEQNVPPTIQDNGENPLAVAEQNTPPTISDNGENPLAIAEQNVPPQIQDNGENPLAVAEQNVPPSPTASQPNWSQLEFNDAFGTNPSENSPALVTLTCTGGGGFCGQDSSTAAAGGTPLNGSTDAVAVPKDNPYGLRIGDTVSVQVGDKTVQNVPVTDYTQSGSSNYVVSGALEKELNGTGSDVALVTPTPPSQPLPGSTPVGQGGPFSDYVASQQTSVVNTEAPVPVPQEPAPAASVTLSQDEGLAFSPPGYQYDWAAPSENEALAYGATAPASAEQPTDTNNSSNTQANATQETELSNDNPYDCSGPCAELQAAQAKANQQAAENALVNNAAVASKGLNALASAGAGGADTASIAAGASAVQKMHAEAAVLGDTQLVTQINKFLGVQNQMANAYASYNAGNWGAVGTLITLQGKALSLGNSILNTVNSKYGK